MPEFLNNKIYLTLDELKPIVKAEGVVDGSFGGLILGNSHSDGGIYVIRQHQTEPIFEIIAEFEGYEYLMHPGATADHLDYLTKINGEFTNVETLPFEYYDVPANINVLDTWPIMKNIKETNKIIILGDYQQFIVNRHSSKKYLIELDNLNEKYRAGNNI